MYWNCHSNIFLVFLSCWSSTYFENLIFKKHINIIFCVSLRTCSAFLFLTDDITNAQTARVESNPGTDLKEHVKVARTMIDSDDNGESNRGVGGGGGGFSGFIIDPSASQPRTEDSYPPRRNFQQQTAHNWVQHRHMLQYRKHCFQTRTFNALKK